MPLLKDTTNFLDTAQYTFSVRRESSLQAAADQFGSLKNRVSINVQDIEKHEITTGQQKYDLILLFNFGLVTSFSDTIIPNAVKSLSETGCICIIDIDQPQLQLGTILGSIQGDRQVIPSNEHLDRRLHGIECLIIVLSLFWRELASSSTFHLKMARSSSA